MKFMELDIQRFAGPSSSFKIRFFKNDSSSDYEDKSVMAAEQIPDCTFTRDGYGFSGWNTAADGTGTGFYTLDTCGTIKNSAEYDSTNDVYIVYAQWQKTVNKYVTFRGLQKYDEKIKDYIAVNSSKAELLSNYTTTTSGDTDYVLDLDKILEEEFSGKLYNDVESGTVGYEGSSNYLLNADFIEIICVKTSDNGHLVVIYNGYRNKISINLNSSGAIIGGYSVGLNNFVESGTPEIFSGSMPDPDEDDAPDV